MLLYCVGKNVDTDIFQKVQTDLGNPKRSADEEIIWIYKNVSKSHFQTVRCGYTGDSGNTKHSQKRYEGSCGVWIGLNGEKHLEKLLKPLYK